MTRERIEDIREIVLPFVKNVLLKNNYENLGKSDAEEFTRDFNEVLDLAMKALEQEPVLARIRAEIERVDTVCHASNNHDELIRRNVVLQIVDKYKTESERKE